VSLDSKNYYDVKLRHNKKKRNFAAQVKPAGRISSSRSVYTMKQENMQEKDLKTIVKEKYSMIAKQSADPVNKPSCGCMPTGCCGTDYSFIGEDYDTLQGYAKEADLGLGCGIPTEYAGLRPGHSVLDLGSGAGNDCFVARAIVGDTGWVTGLDFSEEMIEKAVNNLQKTGFANMAFIAGDIEDMPLESATFDVVLSNCVINLVPDKQKAFAETLRVLKPGGHFCFSDVVIKGELPDALRSDAELYAGCVAGAMKMDDYLEAVRQAGFTRLQVHKVREIEIPRSIFYKYIGVEEYRQYKREGTGIYSLTVSAVKPD
jgi:arsenite methyltransferase